MATVHFATTTKNKIVTPIRDDIDGGSGAGTIKIYTGSMPATTADAITSQVLLGTLTFSDPSGTISGGVLTMSAITDDSSADATGTATWARIADSAGVVVMDIDVTNTGGGGALQLNTVAIVAAGPIKITAFTITVP